MQNSPRLSTNTHQCPEIQLAGGGSGRGQAPRQMSGWLPIHQLADSKVARVGKLAENPLFVFKIQRVRQTHPMDRSIDGSWAMSHIQLRAMHSASGGITVRQKDSLTYGI